MENPRVSQGSVAVLVRVTGTVFIAFLVVGVAMAVLPLHKHSGVAQSTSSWVSSREVNSRLRSLLGFGPAVSPTFAVPNERAVFARCQ
jgi:hypothetical protein